MGFALSRASATRRQCQEAGWLETAWALYQRNGELLLSDRTMTTGPYQVILWHHAALEGTSADFEKVVRDSAAWFNLDQGQLTVRALSCGHGHLRGRKLRSPRWPAGSPTAVQKSGAPIRWKESRRSTRRATWPSAT
jgi:hypothetical protein